MTERQRTQTRLPGIGAVPFIDLDKFKVANDSLGHDGTGGTLLRTAAHRLKRAFQAGDASIQGKVTRAGLGQFAERIHAALAKPVRIGDAEVAIKASIGIAVVAEDDPRGSRQIVRDAEAAMYRAKSSEGKMSCYFMFQLPQQNHSPAPSELLHCEDVWEIASPRP